MQQALILFLYFHTQTQKLFYLPLFLPYFIITGLRSMTFSHMHQHQQQQHHHSAMTPPPPPLPHSSTSMGNSALIDRKPIFLPSMTPPSSGHMSTPPLHHQHLVGSNNGGGGGYYEHIKFSN